jgi:hypothetical protein
MTAVAIRTQFLGAGIRGVTYMATEFGVDPCQRKLSLRQVIVLDGLPYFVVVAVGAFDAKATSVRIIGPVTAVTILRNLVLVHATAVAAKAVQLRVATEQCETRFFLMVELC